MEYFVWFDRILSYKLRIAGGPLSIAFFGFILFSCNQAHAVQEKLFEIDTTTKQTPVKIVDTNIAYLLDKALNRDTFGFDSIVDSPSFIFFKSGHLLKTKERNAIIVRLIDSIYSVSLFAIKEGKWILADSVNVPSGLLAFLYLEFEDFNFDGQTDIYIQSCTSTGDLLIIDPLTKKITFHKEAIGLANMKPDRRTKTVVSESWNGYNRKGKEEITIFTNKWIDGQLKTVSKKNITLK